jgi:DNA-binding GntR family transcriptional regulator
VQLAASYIPEDVAGGVDQAFPDTGPRGIHRRLADRGHRAVRFVEQVDARRPSGEEAEYFKLSSGQPVLQVAGLPTTLPDVRWKSSSTSFRVSFGVSGTNGTLTNRPSRRQT